MKHDLSSYFSANRFARLPFGKMLAAGVTALAILGGSISAAALYTGVPAAPAASSETQLSPAPTRTPDASWLEVDWHADGRLSPYATAVPAPDVEIRMELSGKNQTLGVDLYALCTGEDGTADQKALTGVEIQVTVTCLSLDKLKDDSNAYQNDQSKKGAVGHYTVDTATGSLLLQKLNPGQYQVELTVPEGYIAPAAEKVTVAERVSYTKLQNIKVEAETPENAKEDQQPAKPAENPAPSPDPVPAATPSKVEQTGQAYVKADQYFWSYGGGLYLYYADGTQSAYRAAFATDAAGTEYLLSAEYDPAAAAALAAPAPSSQNASSEASALSARRAAGRLTLLPLTASSADTGVSSVPQEPESQPASSQPADSQPASSQPADSQPSSSQPESQPEDTPEPTATPEPSPEPTATPEPSAEPTATPEPSPEPTATPAMTAAPTTPPVTSYRFYSEGAPVSDGTFRLPEPSKIVTGYIYSGWQTIDGAKYYYDPVTHKPVTGTQVIDGTTYLFNMDGRLSTQVQGIDVSKYQSNINWAQVKAAGVEFVIIRCGYRGYVSGAIVEDPMFAANIRGATAAGLRVGVYFFSQAINEQEAVEEASACLKLVQGYGLSYPIYFDSEYSTSKRTGRADHLTKAERTAVAVAFCETVRNSGYKAGVYASESWFTHQLSYATVSQYSVWNAHYGVSSSGIACDLWQYTGSGRVAGISTDVDMNLSYIG